MTTKLAAVCFLILCGIPSTAWAQGACKPLQADCQYFEPPVFKAYMLVSWDYYSKRWFTANQPKTLEECQHELKNLHFRVGTPEAVVRASEKHPPFCMPYLGPSQ